MKFEELMDKYKKNTASEEEKDLVMQEIDKYKIIEKYLKENINLDFKIDKIQDKQNIETMKLKKRVSNRLKKVIITSVTLVIVILIGLFCILSPIIDSMYYEPTKQSVGENNPDILFDVTAITELNSPGFYLSSDVYTENLGFGKYDIFYTRTNKFTMENDKINMKIKRNQTNIDKFYNINNDMEPEIYFNFTTIRMPDSYNAEQIKENKEKIINHIIKLSPVSYVKAYLTFEDDLTMEELYEFIQFNYRNSSNISFVWAGVRTAPPDTEGPLIIGLNLSHDTGIESIVSPIEDGYEIHYTSLLRYIIDREDAINILEKNTSKSEYYKSALDYAEKNGVKSYGILVYASAEDFIKLAENESIKAIEINQVLASKRYIQ